MEDIKKAIARLDGKTGEIATAFLVSKEYMLTSRHIFISNPDKATYKICFPAHEKEYTINDIYFDEDKDVDNLANDIAIIKLNEPINSIKPLVLDLDFLDFKRDVNWESFGFSGAQRSLGERFTGTLHDIFCERLDKKYDINLYCKAPKIIDGRYGILGASGSPILFNGKVVAVFSNEGVGAIVGACTFKRSRDLIVKQIDDLEIEITETPLQKSIKEAALSTEKFIKGFPDELHDCLSKELYELKEEFINNQEYFEYFLKNSKYPLADQDTMINGVEATLEVLIMLRSIYGNISILMEDDFANLRVTSDKKNDLSFIYSQERNAIMPEILLKIHSQMMSKSAAQIMIENGRSIPPNPLIIDNLSIRLKHNLCNYCGKPFNFKEILQTYIESEDDGLIKGIEKNDFSVLNKVKIICGECVRKVGDQVVNDEELKRMVAEKIYGS